MNDNPLKQYFRQPAIHLKLPSDGQFYDPTTIEMPITKELPIYPMTAIDEITYKTPDALFNGSALISVIQSCVPSIKNPWDILTIDLNPILVAIRIASIGHEYDIETTCPKCENTDEYLVDLNNVLDHLPSIDNYTQPFIRGDLKFYFRPLTYKDINDNNVVQFEEQQLSNLLTDQTVSDEDKIKLLSEAFTKIAKYSVETITKSIVRIETNGAVVTENNYIEDYLRNCDSDSFEAIKQHLRSIKEKEELPSVRIKCAECGHEYNESYTLNMPDFFARNS